MTLFKDKYRIESARLKGWDYSAAGYYYVTICTANRLPAFGEVTGSQMRLSSAGEIVAEEWLKTAQLRPAVDLDAWIIMPDHMHGIVVISSAACPDIREQTSSPESLQATSRLKANSLGAIIGQFKAACTRRIVPRVDPAFAWQTRFWDRIIRDEAELNRARIYIDNNPIKWETNRDRASGLYM